MPSVRYPWNIHWVLYRASAHPSDPSRLRVAPHFERISRLRRQWPNSNGRVQALTFRDFAVANRKLANGSHSLNSKSEHHALRSDCVAKAVMDYGRLDTKIESLAQLSMLDGARADIALMSLGRTYVRRCTSRGGEWTSGLHLFWWIRARLTTEPTVAVTDIRVETALSLSRQIDLAKWAVLMLRLTVIADIGNYAKSHQTLRHVSAT